MAVVLVLIPAPLGGWALSMVLQTLVRCAPPMDALFHTVPLASAPLLPLAALAS